MTSSLLTILTSSILNKGDIKFQSFQMSRNPAFPFLQFSEDTKKQTYDTQLTHQINLPWTFFRK